MSAPGRQVRTEPLAHAPRVLRFLDLVAKKRVQRLYVLSQRCENLGIFDFRHRLDNDAIDPPTHVRDHRVGVDQPLEPVGGVRRGGEFMLPKPDRRIARPVDQGDEQVPLGLEMAVDDGLGHARSLGDLAGRRPRVAMHREQLGGCVEELLLALCGR